MKPFGRMISGFNTSVSSMASLLVLCLIAHVSADVVMRYVFERPLDATILYVSAYYMIAISFLPEIWAKVGDA
jgi:TRAP-type mannitol/chloroaromatic compound transport system permease small subunit